MNNGKRNGNLTAGRMVNFRPVFACVCFLMAGILLSYARMITETPVLWWTVAVLFAPWLFFFSTKNKTRFFVYLLAFYLSFYLGATSFAVKASDYRDSATYSGEYSVTGVVVEKNRSSGGGTIVFNRLTIDGTEEKGKLSLFLYQEDFDALQYCDEVSLQMELRTNTRLTGVYGFRAEAIADKKLYTGSEVYSYEVVGKSFSPGVYLRGRIESALYEGMGEESAAVVSAILLGNTSGIDEGLLQNIRYGGVAHIFAVSGLHIGAVFAFCLLLFRRNRIPAPIRFAIIGFVLLMYGGVCGYSASVIRAIVTCMVFYGCTLLGVKYDPLESLSLSAYIVFAIFPTLLLGVGAQLSFCACLGILLLLRPLREGIEFLIFGALSLVKYRLLRLSKPLPVDMFREDTGPKPLPRQFAEKAVTFVSASLAAQVGTTPILYTAFGYLSVISLLMNCVFVPLITIGFAPILAAVVLSLLFPFLKGALLYVLDVIISLLMLPFHAIDFSGGILSSISLGTATILCCYMAVMFASDKINVPKWQKWGTVVLFAVSSYICLALLT